MCYKKARLDVFIRFALQENADLIFGGVTVICGIVGTLSGGFVLDFMDATISNAFKVKNLHLEKKKLISNS